MNAVKKTLMLLIALLPFAVAAAEEPDIRAFRWNQDAATVTAQEKAPVSGQTDGNTLYKGEFEGIDAVFSYMFSAGRLDGAVYVFKAKHDKPIGYLSDFNKVSDVLKKKYGKPETEKRMWEDQKSKDDAASDESKIAEALAKGKVSMVSVWSTPRADVSHSIEFSNGEMVHVISLSKGKEATDIPPAAAEEKPKEKHKKKKGKKVAEAPKDAPKITAQDPVLTSEEKQKLLGDPSEETLAKEDALKDKAQDEKAKTTEPTKP